MARGALSEQCKAALGLALQEPDCAVPAGTTLDADSACCGAWQGVSAACLEQAVAAYDAAGDDANKAKL